MPTILKIKNSVTTTVTPTTLVRGELAVNIADKKMWVGNAATTPVQILGAGATVAGGSNTQVQYNSSGSLAGSANMTFDGSTLTTLNTAYTGTLTGGTGVVNLGSGQFYKDASGNVGIGTSSPSVKLDVTQSVNASATIRLTNSNAGTSSSSGLNVSNGTSVGQFTIAGTSYGGYGAWLASETMAYSGTNLVLMADAGSGIIKFATGGNGEKMRIDSSGNLLVGLNSATSGGGVLQVSNGITFPATQSASSNANTLDDYEEGTFTPTLVPASGSITSQTGTGKYTKIGRVVTVYTSCLINTAGTASGAMTLTGLPFTAVDRAATALVREDNVTGYAYMFITQSSTNQGGMYTLTTNGPPPYGNSYIYTMSLTYLTT